MNLHLAFWNVENFFDWRVGHGRKTGPKSREEYEAKLEAVAGVIRSLFPGQMPDLLGLAEVGDRTVFEEILLRLGDPYAGIWVDAGREDSTGLGIVYRETSVSVSEVATYPEKEAVKKQGLRPRYLAVDVTVTESGVKILFVVSHWKSNRGFPKKVLSDRRDTARVLGDFLLEESSRESRPAILVGDFNADPYDGIFDGQRIRGRRSYTTLKSWRNEMATLYNPCWRFLPPDAPFPEALVPQYRQERPQTTLERPEGVYDQFLFSKSLLTDPRIGFREEDVRIFYDESNSRHGGGGRRIPNRWAEDWAPGAGGVSDHFPICAMLTLSKEIGNG